MISSKLMVYLRGRGPKKAVCGECIHFDGDEEGYWEAFCLEGPKPEFEVYAEWSACSLFKTASQVEREQLEASGQTGFAFKTMGRLQSGGRLTLSSSRSGYGKGAPCV